MKKGTNNPYTLIFGKLPTENIPRIVEYNEVLESFENDPPNQQTYMITGVRGSGKTVFMTELAQELRKRDDWMVVELSTSQDLLLNLAQILYNENQLVKLLKNGGGFSLLGFGVQVNGTTEITNSQLAIREALKRFKKQNKKLLVCIDEIIANDYVKEFVSLYQIFIREDLPLYLIMTGLYENISDLRDEKNLTFLYRAPEIKLKPLNKGTIAENYINKIGVTKSDAEKMAELTKGYSFAFQVLGYFTYKHDGNYKDAIPEYRQYLEDYVYEKLWSELSQGDKKILYAIAKTKNAKAKDIMEIAGIKNNEYTPYRKRLIKKMIVDGEEYGYLKLTLPLFDEFILRQ